MPSLACYPALCGRPTKKNLATLVSVPTKYVAGTGRQTGLGDSGMAACSRRGLLGGNYGSFAERQLDWGTEFKPGDSFWSIALTLDSSDGFSLASDIAFGFAGQYLPYSPAPVGRRSGCFERCDWKRVP